MKHILPIILSILLLSACGESGRNSQLLNRAEAVMDDSCEVALSILQDSIDTTTLATERDRAIYAVLLSQALDKNYIDITSDSIITPAMKYFADGDDPHYAMLSHYYYGKTLLNQNKLSDAIIACNKATDFAIGLNNDFYLGLIYGTLGDIYNKIHNHNESINYNRLSYLYFHKIDKQPHEKYAYFSLAISHNNNGDFHESQKIFKELIDSAIINSDTIFMVEVLESYSLLLWNNQKDSQAKLILTSLQNKYNHRLSSKSLAHLANIYSKEGLQDSTKYYLDLAKNRILDKNDSIAITQSEYIISYNDKDYKYAFDNLYLQTKRLNETTKEVWQQSVMSLLRDYFESQAKNANLEVETQKNQIILIITISVAILLIAIFIIYTQRMRNAIQKERINRILNEHYQTQNLISNAQKRINELENLLANETDKSQCLINELAIHKESLQLYNQQAKLKKEATDSIESSEIVARFRKRLFDNTNPTINDWDQLDKYINQQFSGFKCVLYKLAKLNDIEYQVCLLIKCKFSPTEIANITNRSRHTMSPLRSRLYYKLFKKRGSTHDFDEFINSL